MRKVGRLNERELTKLVRQVLSENDFSVEPHIPTQPREKDVRGVFGKKYGPYIPIDVIRYMRKAQLESLRNFMNFMVIKLMSI